MPPVLSDAIANGSFFDEIIVGNHSDAANRGVVVVFRYDSPLIMIRMFVSVHPIGQKRFGQLYACMGGPGQIARHFRIRCPIVKHGLCIVHSKSTKKKSRCFQRFCSQMFHCGYSNKSKSHFCNKSSCASGWSSTLRDWAKIALSMTFRASRPLPLERSSMA